MARWYDKNSKAVGDGHDVRQCARGFSEASRSMLEARPKAARFERGGDGSSWESDAAEMLREQMDLVPDLMRRFAAANGNVASALEAFAPQLDGYQDTHRRLQREGHETRRDIDVNERARERRYQELSGDDNVFEQGWNWLSGEYGDDPQIRSLNAEIDRLEDELRRLRSQYYNNDDEFRDDVGRAIDLVRDADTVLYNNGWDKFWTQTLEPIIDIIRVVLQVAAIVLAIAALVGSGGTLAPLIVAALLAATSAAKIAGTAAAGREVTGEMWMNFALDLAGLVTAGLAHKAAGLKAASQANADEAARLLQGKASFNSAAKASAHMKNVERLDDAYRTVDTMKDVAEGVEATLSIVDGGMKIADGDYIEGGLAIAGGVFEGGDTVFKYGGDIAEGVSIGAGLADIANTVDPEFLNDWNSGLENLSIEAIDGAEAASAEAFEPADLDGLVVEERTEPAEPMGTAEWPGVDDTGKGIR